jgi:membrane protease YdiL (CAAX protease family)
MHTDVKAFGTPGVFGLAVALTVAAIIGKQACSLGVVGKGIDRWTIGFGMIPRGEVGLIFANIGLGLVVAGERIVDSTTFSAIVVMVMVTTMVTPPALKWSLGRVPKEPDMRIGFLGTYHLVFFGVFIPYAAIKSSRVIGTKPLPPKVKFLISQIFTLLVFFAISALVERKEWITLFPAEMPGPTFLLLGAAVLVAMVTLMRPMWRKRVEQRGRKLWLFMPRTPRERALWIGCSIAAGISEEVTYRGVMFGLLWRLTDSAWAAALIAALVFSVSHFLQGWTSMSIIFGIALTFQMLAWFTGSLYVGMAVHALYDIAAGLSYGWFGEKLGYPLEPMPA